MQKKNFGSSASDNAAVNLLFFQFRVLVLATLPHAKFQFESQSPKRGMKKETGIFSRRDAETQRKRAKQLVFIKHIACIAKRTFLVTSYSVSVKSFLVRYSILHRWTGIGFQ